MILNLINNKRYIGSSTNLINRSFKHISSLRNNKHHCIHLQRSKRKFMHKIKAINIITKEELIFESIK